MTSLRILLVPGNDERGVLYPVFDVTYKYNSNYLFSTTVVKEYETILLQEIWIDFYDVSVLSLNERRLRSLVAQVQSTIFVSK
jgi:hypothetical protein